MAIITWCNKNINYGQVLQAYAMQRIVKKYGFDPIIINYRKLEEREDSLLSKNKYIRGLYEWYRGLEKAGTDYIRTKLKFNKFVHDYVNLSYPCYTKSEIEELVRLQNCRFLVCGSDQIWNPACFDPVYYLDFCNNDKDICRIAYAPSVAEDNINTRNQHIFIKMTKLINQIDYVSVREEDSAKILRKLTDKTVVSLLDPTFLISKKGWDKIAKKNMCKERYIFCYILGDLKQHRNNIRKLSNKYNTEKVIYLNTHNNGNYTNEDFLNNIGPREFVTLIKYSEAIYTDSFHGIALSINLNKEFYACKRYNVSAYNKKSRITNILGIFGLENRYIDIKGCINDDRLDYIPVNKILKSERKKSFTFLDKAFKNRK